MLLSRTFLVITFVLFLECATVLAQPAPVQQQRIQQQPIQTPRFGTPDSPPVYQVAPQPPGPVAGQPVRVASSQPATIPLYDAGAQRTPITIQPPAAQGPAGSDSATQGIPQGMVHMGRSEPASKIVPFFLDPAEQRELDEFLARWERYSATIRRYDVDFNVFEYDPTIPGALPNKEHRILWGSFKYIANPMRFLYVIKGEYRDGKYVERDGDKNPHIYAEKIIIDEKTVSKYDYNAKTVHQINVPPEMIGKGIADSPLPLIFGAKADELKRRFSMKVVTEPNGLIRLYARPLLIEDQSEFKELVILLDKDLRARGLQQWDINDKSYKVFDLKPPRINDKLGSIMADVVTVFKPEVERGWKKEVHDWTLPPSPTPSAPQMQMGNPAPPQQPRADIPLYQGR